MQILSRSIILQMDRANLTIGTHAEGVYHFEKSRVVHFLLDSLKAENDSDIFFSCLVVILLQKAKNMFWLQNRIALGQVLEQYQRVEQVKGSQNFLDTVYYLLAFWNGNKERREHLVNLEVGLLGHFVKIR